MSVPPRNKWGDDDCGWNCPDENTDKCLTCNQNNSGKPGVPGPLPSALEKFYPSLKMLLDEYFAAVNKHPEFPKGEGGVAIIAEELGELAQEYNDKKEGWRERAKKEAAHVAVTALREMIALDEEEQKENQNGTMPSS